MVEIDLAIGTAGPRFYEVRLLGCGLDLPAESLVEAAHCLQCLLVVQFLCTACYFTFVSYFRVFCVFCPNCHALNRSARGLSIKFAQLGDYDLEMTDLPVGCLSTAI